MTTLFPSRRQFLSLVAASTLMPWRRGRGVLGIGTATKIDWIEIEWPPPSGRVERLTDVPIDRYVTIVEGQGRITA